MKQIKISNDHLRYHHVDCYIVKSLSLNICFDNKLECVDYICASPVPTKAQMVKKNLPAVQEPRVLSLGWEDPLEEEKAPHSSILAWKIPRTEEPGGQQSMGSQKGQTRLRN